MPSRAIPRVGERVSVAFLALRVRGVVAHADAEQRAVSVLTEEGETVRFVLNRATGRFLSDGRQTGARLLFTG